MTRFKLLLRNLRHFRLANLAVVAGMVVATAVLTGALMVGDSVRASLADLALQRLGPIDYALVSSRYFNEDLAQRIQTAKGFTEYFDTCIAGILVTGGAANDPATAHTGGVQIAALQGDLAPIAPGAGIINGRLSDELGSHSGNTILLTLPNVEETPRDATLSRRGRGDTVSGLRLTVTHVAAEPGVLSMFTLTGGQRLPRNVWVNLKELQSAIGQDGRANLLLIKAKPNADPRTATAKLNAILAEIARLDDYGLAITHSPIGHEAILNSRTTYISPTIDRAADSAAKQLGFSLRKVSVYLINNVVKVDGAQPAKAIHYAIAAGLSDLDGQPLQDDEIALNAWSADQLQAKVGDRIRLDYFQRRSTGELAEVRGDASLFKVAKIIPMTGLGADSTLTPTYKGLTDAASMASWEAPEGLDIDKKLVTPADEAYWKQYRAAPKIFISLSTAHKLWGNVYGELNSLRLPADKSIAFAESLRKTLSPAESGLLFTPIKAQQLAASTGSTDFSGLFVGFSFFVIAAAAILVAMLFRLGVEQRARQFGLLGALGFTPKSQRRMALAEGMLLALIGGLIGIAAAIGYTALMMAGLRTWWIGAVGTTALRLHVLPITMATGLAIGLGIAFVAVWWAVRRVGRTEAANLLAGAWGTKAQSTAKGRIAQATAILASCAGATLLALGMAAMMNPQAAFMAGGGLLLVGGLCFIATQLNPRRYEPSAGWSLARLGLRNAGRHRARSVMTIGLIAFASFVLVTVSSLKQGPSADTHEKRSGTGGFQLIVQADVPLLGDLNTKKGRDLLGIRQSTAEIWNRAGFIGLRTWAGQDISCLNLTRPTAPTIVSVPPSLADRDAFIFAGMLQKSPNPWDLLTTDFGPDIPVIADDETASYILKLNLGDTLPITDQTGRQRNLKLVATLAHSIFQSELLMSEANFAKLFPSQSGFGMVLAKTPPPDETELRRLIGNELEDFAVTVETTAERLARYQEVANTYLSTFQVLGSLGLLLGTIGLAVILLRGLVERKAELALLSAIGFRKSARAELVLAENAFLLLIGLVVGAGCALIGVLPTILSSTRSINPLQLALTLAAVLITGLTALAAAIWLGGRRITPADLRAE
jgi:ABC-type antimicrobial peptide transport system permease subunit